MVEQVSLHLIRNYSAAHVVNDLSPTYWGQIQVDLECMMEWFWGVFEGQIGANHDSMKDNLVMQLPYKITHGFESLQ